MQPSRWLTYRRMLLGAFASALVLLGAAVPANAGPPEPPSPPVTFPECKMLLSPAAVTLFGAPFTELSPVTLVATRDAVIKQILYDNPSKNCRWSTVYGKVIIDFTLSYITVDERAQLRSRWLTAYGQPGVNIGGDNWIYHRSTGYPSVESAILTEIPYYLTALANDGTYFPAFMQAEADRVFSLLG